MDWTNRGGERPAESTTSQQSAAHPAQAAPRSGKKLGRIPGTNGPLKWGFIALLFSAVILAVATIGYTALGNTGSSESSYVKSKQMQAVFLNGGQVYFGKITNLNSKSLRLGDIYYLRVNQQVQPNQSTSQSSNSDISLVKLGCELHGPDDSMVINREQVMFWENLKDDGQVAKAVAKYKTDNPDGQNCATQQSQSSNTGTTTGSSNTSTTKK